MKIWLTFISHTAFASFPDIMYMSKPSENLTLKGVNPLHKNLWCQVSFKFTFLFSKIYPVDYIYSTAQK